MDYTPHELVKPEVIAKTAVGLVERELIIPKLFTRLGIEDYKGAQDDVVMMKIPGVLPAHEYKWRNKRTQPIFTDQYQETKIPVSFGGNAYSAVAVTDEQAAMDLGGWTELLTPQCQAVSRHLEEAAAQMLENCANVANHDSIGNYSHDYMNGYGYHARDDNYVSDDRDKSKYNARVLAAREGQLTKDINESRRLLSRIYQPTNNRILLVGTDFDAAMQEEEAFNHASFVGDANANSALKEATIGKWKGFTIVTSNAISPAKAFAFTPGAFAFLNAAPIIPESVGFAATASYNGIAMRFIRDYDAMYMHDRSIVNTWYGFQYAPVWGLFGGLHEHMEPNEENGHRNAYGIMPVITLDLNAKADRFVAHEADYSLMAALGFEKRARINEHSKEAAPVEPATPDSGADSEQGGN